MGNTAGVYDAELHAIQEVLQAIHGGEYQQLGSNTMLICVDNQPALATLSTGNPKNTEFARKALEAVEQLSAAGWAVSGLWTLAHCGIPGNEEADALAKQGAKQTTACARAEVTRKWLLAKAQSQQTEGWRAR